MTQPYNRFDLEEEIMNIWQTEDDLDAVVHRMMINPDPIPNKEIANLLIAVSKLHDLRCQKLFDVFEKMVQDKCFINKNWNKYNLEVIDIIEGVVGTRQDLVILKKN